MSTLTTIQSTDLITNSRADINGNFNALNTDKEEVSNKSTDSTFASADDTTYPTTLATKKYVDAGGNVNASETQKGIVEEATQAEVDAGTATGGTGARLFVNPSTLTGQFSLIEKKTLGADSATVTFTDLGAYHHVLIIAATTILRDDVSGNTLQAFVSTDNGSTFLNTNAYIASVTSVTDDYIFLGSNAIGVSYVFLQIDLFNTTIPLKPVSAGFGSSPGRYSVVTSSALNAVKIYVTPGTGNHRFSSGDIFYAYGIAGTLATT